MDMQKTIGLVLRELRALHSTDDHFMSQQEVADCAQISVRYYHDIENGKRMPSIDVVGRLAHVFGLSLTDFCSKIENTTEK